MGLCNTVLFTVIVSRDLGVKGKQRMCLSFPTWQ
jgi:hypothetical protein